nr:sugar transport protein 13 [Ipomoea batatas]GME03162.1 sugar transport protein 13 [Ipomoea batatas]
MAFFFNGGIRLPFADAEFRARIPAILRWIAAASGGMMCGYSQQILGGLLSMPIFLNKLSRAWYLRQEMSDSTNFCDAQSVGMIYFSTLFTFGTCVGGFLGLVMHSRRWPRFTSFLGAVLVLGGAVTSAARVDPFPITSTLLFLLIGTGIGMTRVGIPVLLLRISPDHARDSLDRTFDLSFSLGGFVCYLTNYLVYKFFKLHWVSVFIVLGVIVLVFLLALILVGRINARDTTEPYRPIRVLMREHRPLVIFRVGFGILPQLLGLGSLVLVPFAFESINFGANDLPFTALVVWGALAFVITTISSVYVIPRFGRRGTIFLSLLAFALSQVSLGPVLRHAGNARNGILRYPFNRIVFVLLAFGFSSKAIVVGPYGWTSSTYPLELARVGRAIEFIASQFFVTCLMVLVSNLTCVFNEWAFVFFSFIALVCMRMVWIYGRD